MNPLLFVPSVREIPEVIESWNELPYDKYVVRMMLEAPAYQTARDFFLLHKEYTHIVICPDDLVIHYDAFEMLLRDVEEYDLSNLSGVAYIDEGSIGVYCCKPKGIDLTNQSKGSFYEDSSNKNVHPKNILPNKIFEVGFTGFCCQFLERELVEKMTFKGGCEDGAGCMDLEMAYNCQKLDKPMMVQPNAFFTHLRNRCKEEVQAWKKRGTEAHIGYTIHLTNGEKYEMNSY